MKKLTLALILFSLSSQAAFYTTTNLVVRPQKLNRALEASLRYATWYAGDSTCSSVALSPDGYVLTNLHCVRKCLIEDQDASEIKYTYVHNSQYRLLQVHQRAPKNIKCDSFGGAFTMTGTDGSLDYYGDPEIVFLGEGHGSFPDDDKISELPTDVFNQLISSMGDYAILKFNINPQRPLTCIPLSQEKLKPGHAVWSIGYPARTMRGDGLDSTGWLEHITFGHVRSSIVDDPILQSFFGPFNHDPDQMTDKNLKSWTLTQKLWNQKKFLLTDLDAVAGSSGSMIIDKMGELQALLFLTIKASYHHETNATVIGMKATYIKNEVQKFLGLSKTNEIFNCPKN